jgi:hypothetical protein
MQIIDLLYIFTGTHLTCVLSCTGNIRNKEYLHPGKFQSGHSQVPRSVPSRMHYFAVDPQTYIVLHDCKDTLW